MVRKNILLLLIAVMLLGMIVYAGYASRQVSPPVRQELNTSQAAVWHKINVSAPEMSRAVIGTRIGNDDYDNKGSGFKTEVFETYYAANHTVAMKGQVSIEQLPALIFSSDGNVTVYLKQILVSSRMEDGENVAVGSKVNMDGIAQAVDLRVCLVDKHCNRMSSWGGTLFDRSEETMTILYPVNNIEEIGGVEFNITYIAD